jgi:hypothetical protein
MTDPKVEAMVRQRYIVEFPRPSNSTPGAHGMEVKIAKGDYLIRAAGVSMPVPNASLMKDPATIQSGPSQAPLEGPNEYRPNRNEGEE